MRDTLRDLTAQVEFDLKSAHFEICKLQGLDPAEHSWPDWSPQANTLRWVKEIRKTFDLDDTIDKAVKACMLSDQ